ncbi:MAG: IPT/TIG domain-containing protein [Chitinophagaceae bacterium]|nr:IPT/TIG domain-containing protein [Chitinophagaceae bacterium]
MRNYLFLLFTACIFLLFSCKKDNAAGRLTMSGFASTVITGGDVVSIYGSGFDPDPTKNRVLFNGIAGEVATASPNRLQVITPLLANSGKITVTTHGQTVTSEQSYTIVCLLQGTYNDNFTLTPDKQYMLRGDVEFQSKLTIQPGTVIYGEKLSHGNLMAGDIDFEGTAEHPIVFTSDQPPGSRFPGDWGGVTIGTSRSGRNITNGIVKYVRVEYAENGLALAAIAGGTYQYLQASYCYNGITLSSSQDVRGYEDPAAPYGFVHHIIAFGCVRNDFVITKSSVAAQFGLGIKDPYFADTGPVGRERINSVFFYKGKANGIYSLYENIGGTLAISQLSNFTLVGYNPDARNILGIGATISRDAGSAVQADGSSDIVICNSLMAASWKSAVAVPWYHDNYDTTPSNNMIAFRNNFITGTSALSLPQQGGILGIIDAFTPYISFVDMQGDLSGLQLFSSLNDTTSMLSFSRSRDDLGIKDLVDYNRLHNPGVLPASGSKLLQSARFPPGSISDNPAFDKNVPYVGAFGTEDWTKSWSNFNPQQTRY